MFMKTDLLFVAIALALTSLALAAETELKDQKDKISYGIGLDIGSTLKRQKIHVDPQILNAGIQDGLSGKKPRLTESQVKEVMSKAQEEMSNNLVAAKKAAGEKNALEGPKFLAENKTKEGVKTTASGLHQSPERRDRPDTQGDRYGGGQFCWQVNRRQGIRKYL